MKINFTRILALLTVIMLCYTACKKTGNQPVAKATTDYAALSSKIALNLIQSLSGKYGGTDINNGIKAPSSIAVNHRGAVLYDVNALCGFTIDTVFSKTIPGVDTTKTFKGNFHFVYTCSTNQVDGYTVHDSLTNTETGAIFNNTFIVSQNYTVKALDQTYKIVSMNGSILSSIVSQILTNAAVTGYHDIATTYTLTGLKVDFTSGVADVTAGVATFTGVTGDLDATTPKTGTVGGFTGSLTFLGNHMATLSVTIGAVTKTYSVNLITGVVS
jgi:hypothetical protein